ncbi:hypothetical protein DMN91_000395, partial [Ooceraea biroi]
EISDFNNILLAEEALSEPHAAADIRELLTKERRFHRMGSMLLSTTIGEIREMVRETGDAPQ